MKIYNEIDQTPIWLSTWVEYPLENIDLGGGKIKLRFLLANQFHLLYTINKDYWPHWLRLTRLVGQMSGMVGNCLIV